MSKEADTTIEGANIIIRYAGDPSPDCVLVKIDGLPCFKAIDDTGDLVISDYEATAFATLADAVAALNVYAILMNAEDDLLANGRILFTVETHHHHHEVTP